MQKFFIVEPKLANGGFGKKFIVKALNVEQVFNHVHGNVLNEVESYCYIYEADLIDLCK